MHTTYLQAIGTEIIEEQHHEIVGYVHGLILDPDKGTIVALVCRTIICPEPCALLVHDIRSWGKRIHVRSLDVIGPLNDVVRLQSLLSDNRPLRGQRIETKSGTYIGICWDIQFDTTLFSIEWIFPRKFFWRKVALPASDIIEVTKNAILVRNQIPKEEKIIEEVNEISKIDTVQAPVAGMSLIDESDK